MKNIRIYTFIILFMVGILNCEFVYAAEETTEYTYTIYYQDNPTIDDKESGNYTINTSEMTFTTDKKIVVYWKWGQAYFCYLGENGYGEYLFGANNLSLIANEYDYYYHHVRYRDSSIYEESSSEAHTGGSSPTGMNVYRNMDDVDVFKLNIPIFEDYDSAVAYLKGELTEKDALNYESDLTNIVYDLETPIDLKSKKIDDFFEGAMLFTWKQKDENYDKWETEIYIYENFKYRDSFLVFSWADWQYVNDYYLLTETVDTYRLEWKYTEEIFEKHDCYDKRINDYPTEYGGIYEPIKDIYYIRNHYFDGEIHHYSNWVVAEFDYATGKVTTSYIEKEGSDVEVDDGGQVVIGDSGRVEDSQYTGSDYAGHEEVAANDIVGFIKDGFGFLGDGGLMELMKGTFGFIPSELWSVFIAGIGLMVVVAIFKFVRG